MQGRGVEGRVVKGEGIMPPTVSQPSVNASIDTGGSVRDEGKGKEQRESCQKVVFLSTWTSHSKAPQASVKVITIQPLPTSTSIHHFCMEPLFPQLPATLQTISRRTHTSREDRSHKKVNITLTAAIPLGFTCCVKFNGSLSYCHHLLVCVG